MRSRLFIAALSFLIISSFSFAEKKPFEIADFYRIKPIGDLAMSPCGKWVAFSVTTFDLEEAKRTQAIWIKEVNGRGEMQLTSGEYRDRTPVWSPSGKTIAFLSDRTGKNQIYLIPVDGGEARQLTDISTGVNDPQWSPDGSFIAFTSTVYPECGANEACNKEIQEKWEKGALKAHVADSLLYRHWNSWSDGKTDHILLVSMEGKVRDLTPGPHESPVFSLGGGHRYDISPDGKTMVFASKRVPYPAESTNSDIFMERLDQEIEESSARNLTSFNEAADTIPRFSPDGKHLAYLTQRIPIYESDLWRIGLYEVEGMKHTLITDSHNFDNWVNDYEWSHDSRRIYFTADVKGDNPVYCLHLKDGKIEKIFTHETIGSFAVDPEEKFIVYIHRAVGEPWEIYRYNVKEKKEPERITFFNQRVMEEVDIRPAERITVPGANGKPVEVFLVKPHNFDPEKKYPLILNVHGGPQSQWQDSFRGDWQVYPGLGYIVAFPNPHGSTGYGQEYTAAISGDWGGKVYEDLMKVADHLEQLPFVDKDRMGAMGWSYGGYMMNWFLGHTDRFKCIASMMGSFNLHSKYGATEELWFPEWDLKGTPWDSDQYDKWSPHNFVKNFKTPTLIITGERDYRIPYTESLQLFTALQRMRVPSRLIVFADAGHWPSWNEMAFYYLAHADWFHRYLGGAPPPWSVEDFLRNRIFKKPEK